MSRPTATAILRQSLPQPPYVTPFNVIAGVILTGGMVILVIRFALGLESVTNLTHDSPWGLWIGFDVMSGVALAAGGFTISSAVYLFGMKEYKPLVRPALLTGFLGYFLVVLGLLADLGRPYRLPYAFSIQAGPTSAMFEVALCVALYLTTLFVESTPAFFEWLGWKRWRKLVVSMTIALTIFGLLLSTLHQSSLGGLFMVSATRLHPLWYTVYTPVHFFVSAVLAGISMVIVESMLSHRAFRDTVEITHERLDRLTLGLAKAGAIVCAIYFSIKVMGVALDHEWSLLFTGWGAWFGFELLGFVVLPGLMYTVAYREKRVGLARAAGVIAVIGIVLNRLNVSCFAFNWELPVDRWYFPSVWEIWVSVFFVTLGLVAFRWIANRTPILYEHPDYRGQH